ncbi:MAG: acetate/propionate family kinase [bacterium]|nr:acetate/propionate family kinase [bacterium]
MKSNATPINILVLNCGSSSLKYKIIRMPEEQELVSGEAERVGIKTQDTPMITHYVFGQKRVVKTEIPNHTVAFRKALSLIKEDHKTHKSVTFDIFAHRYVHPGTWFSKTTKITNARLERLRETLQLAPLHNPISFALVELCTQEYPEIPQYVVFDTAFHSTIPKELYSYALPMKLVKKYGLRKIGFHGISHQYVSREACRYLNRDYRTQRIISCHLGTGGSSVCAIDCGKSINNSMGFTPLEGLMMNTRSGDLDLGLLFYIMFKENISPEDTETILNKKSGVLGIFKNSSDLRDVIKSINNDYKAKMAFNMYVRRVKKYICYYILLLRKADIILFTDSIGVGVPLIREEICQGLDFFGIKLDKFKNANYTNGIQDISTLDSETRILVLPTDEEIMIAREAYKEFNHDNRY